jgi:hypothetical protein
LVNHTVALYVPTTRLLAVEFKLTVTVAAGPPGVSVPPPDETVSHADVLASVQFNELVPVLVRVTFCVK